MFVWTIAALCLYGFKLVHAHSFCYPKPRVPNLCRFFQNLKIVTKVLTNPLNMLLTLKPLSTGYSNYKHTNALNQLKWMLPCIWRGMVAEVYGGRGIVYCFSSMSKQDIWTFTNSQETYESTKNWKTVPHDHSNAVFSLICLEQRILARCMRVHVQNQLS